MKYVQGKQRWGWCTDLPLPWLTATCPVPLLIYKACRVSARVASLASLPRHKGTFITPCLHFNHQERSDNKTGAPISYSVQSSARHRRRQGGGDGADKYLQNASEVNKQLRKWVAENLWLKWGELDTTWEFRHLPLKLCTYPANLCHTVLLKKKKLQLKLASQSLQLQHFVLQWLKAFGGELTKKT